MRQQFLLPALGLAFAGLTIFLGYFVQRTDFQSFLSAYAAFFGLYVWAVFFLPKIPANSLIGLGVVLRALLLFSIPNLSDDYARFLWDGHLTVAGIHPFAQTPRYFIENQIFPPGITLELFGKLNSPDYFTVYPPVCQAVFGLAAWVFPQSELGGVFIMKLFLLACEFGTLKILQHLRAHAAAYALNPLAILEISGNCHFEGAMIFFLLAGIAALHKGKWVKSALLWSLAIASKMLPLMFLPMVWRRLGWQKGLKFNLILAAACLLLFAPVLAVLPNILESLDLYFRQFQFNASMYYLVREIGFAQIGWDIGEFSGPILGGITVLGILLITFQKFETFEKFKAFEKFSSLETVLLFALMLYLSLAASVQPWYVTAPLALSLLTRWRFAVLWSGLVALSYSHYDKGGFKENYALIAIEYAVLWGFFLWECWERIVRRSPQNSV